MLHHQSLRKVKQYRENQSGKNNERPAWWTARSRQPWCEQHNGFLTLPLNELVDWTHRIAHTKDRGKNQHTINRKMKGKSKAEKQKQQHQNDKREKKKRGCLSCCCCPCMLQLPAREGKTKNKTQKRRRRRQRQTDRRKIEK